MKWKIKIVSQNKAKEKVTKMYKHEHQQRRIL